MNRFDEVLIVNPGVPDAERERQMYGYFAQTPQDAFGAVGDPYGGYGYAAYPEPEGYGYYGYGDPGLYAAPGYGFADAYGYAAPYGYAAADPYGYGYGYGNVDPYAMGQIDSQVYGPADLYGYDGYAPGYGDEPPAYGYYGAADPFVYGAPEAPGAEMGGWSSVAGPDESAPTFYADGEPEFGAYTRDVSPAPFNAVCPIVGNVRFGAGDELQGYVAPAPVGPTCGAFVPQPGTPPPIPDTFKPLW
jgi:hypothetical protein